MRAAQRAAALCLLLAACAVTMGAAQEPPAGGAGPAAAAADPATAEPVSVCNPGTLAPNATKPVPCTPEQEAAALADLAADTNTTDPLAAVFDTSACDPADPEGYTQAVDLMNPELILVGAWGAAGGKWEGGGSAAFLQLLMI